MFVSYTPPPPSPEDFPVRFVGFPAMEAEAKITFRIDDAGTHEILFQADGSYSMRELDEGER